MSSMAIPASRRVAVDQTHRRRALVAASLVLAASAVGLVGRTLGGNGLEEAVVALAHRDLPAGQPRVAATAPPSSTPTHSPPPSYPAVSICAIAKYQGDDLPEWLAWHEGVGVSHVYLYDHGSAPPLAASPGLAPFLASGFLSVIRAPAAAGSAHPSGRAQLWAYDDCLATAGRGETRSGPDHPPPGVNASAWAGVVSSLQMTPPADPAGPSPPQRPVWLAFIDVDEFIMPTSLVGAVTSAAAAGEDDGSTGSQEAVASLLRTAVPAALAAFDADHPAAGGLALNWVLFGSGGHNVRPPGSVLASYTACLPTSEVDSRHVKSVVRVESALRVGVDPHHFIYAPGHPALNARGQAVPGAIAPPDLGPAVVEPIVLHHYATKSRAEYAAKMARGSGMGNFKPAAWLDSVDKRATEVCEAGRVLGAVVVRGGGSGG